MANHPSTQAKAQEVIAQLIAQVALATTQAICSPHRIKF